MKKHLKWLIPVLAVVVLAAAFLIYTGIYYHADDVAMAALESTDAVTVTRTGYGWFFDGPSEEDLLVFYPGAKIEETAYAPLLHVLAAAGVDVCLVKMPFRLAIFGANKAEKVLSQYDHPNKYVGGHSLGGAMAANFAAEHGAELRGVVLLAAYPTKPLDNGLTLISIYGSNDGVLNMAKLERGRQYAPPAYYEVVIDGGNHAQFANYGTQRGDGTATKTSDQQHTETILALIRIMKGA